MSLFFEEESDHQGISNFANNILCESQQSPILPRNTPTAEQLHTPEQRPSSPRVPKKRQIQKKEKPTASKPQKKKKKKEKPNAPTMGRPVNEDAEKPHLKESKAFNDIIYHYARFSIFMKLRSPQASSLALALTNKQSQWMCQTQQIMRKQNFPEYNERNVVFLLHPNSLHFVFQSHKKNLKRQTYSPEEVKFMFMAVLKKKNLLNQQIYDYINNYWEDICYLVNNHNGEPQMNVQIIEREPIRSEENINMVSSNSDQPNLIQDNRASQRSESMESEEVSGMKGKTKKSELELMREELADDDSILAYEIACYLHACSEKFWFRITSTQ